MVQEEMTVAGPGLWGRRCREADSLGPGLNQWDMLKVWCAGCREGELQTCPCPPPSLPSGRRKSK